MIDRYRTTRITNVLLADGTGKPLQKGELRLQGNRILEVGEGSGPQPWRARRRW
ncbi:MAG: hypothetical protein IPK21_14775 [Haliscomenobacter sp.]|nr:hypothetical protein [Haliscomenobacter sp.]